MYKVFDTNKRKYLLVDINNLDHKHEKFLSLKFN